MKSLAIIPPEVTWAEEKRTHSLRYFFVGRVLTVGLDHVVQSLTCMRQAIIPDAKHIDYSMPEPTRLAIREVDTKLLLQNACRNAEIFVMLGQITQIDLVLPFISLYSRQLNQSRIE